MRARQLVCRACAQLLRAAAWVRLSSGYAEIVLSHRSSSSHMHAVEMSLCRRVVVVRLASSRAMLVGCLMHREDATSRVGGQRRLLDESTSKASCGSASSHPRMNFHWIWSETTTRIGTLSPARLAVYPCKTTSVPIAISRGAAESSCRRIKILVPDKVHNGTSAEDRPGSGV